MKPWLTINCELCHTRHVVTSGCTPKSDHGERFYSVTVERLPMPVFHNGHGPRCTCMSCVMARGEQRAADLRARGLG